MLTPVRAVVDLLDLRGVPRIRVGNKTWDMLRNRPVVHRMVKEPCSNVAHLVRQAVEKRALQLAPLVHAVVVRAVLRSHTLQLLLGRHGHDVRLRRRQQRRRHAPHELPRRVVRVEAAVEPPAAPAAAHEAVQPGGDEERALPHVVCADGALLRGDGAGQVGHRVVGRTDGRRHDVPCQLPEQTLPLVGLRLQRVGGDALGTEGDVAQSVEQRLVLAEAREEEDRLGRAAHDLLQVLHRPLRPLRLRGEALRVDEHCAQQVVRPRACGQRGVVDEDAVGALQERRVHQLPKRFAHRLRCVHAVHVQRVVPLRVALRRVRGRTVPGAAARGGGHGVGEVGGGGVACVGEELVGGDGAHEGDAPVDLFGADAAHVAAEQVAEGGGLAAAGDAEERHDGGAEVRCLAVHPVQAGGGVADVDGVVPQPAPGPLRGGPIGRVGHGSPLLFLCVCCTRVCVCVCL
eukprot:Rhum_TRINITY_DN14494_c10_g3::Rhum_TRINITY_DN14494_c10_g3_i1::g.92944::m.92944